MALIHRLIAAFKKPVTVKIVSEIEKNKILDDLISRTTGLFDENMPEIKTINRYYDLKKCYKQTPFNKGIWTPKEAEKEYNKMNFKIYIMRKKYDFSMWGEKHNLYKLAHCVYYRDVPFSDKMTLIKILKGIYGED